MPPSIEAELAARQRLQEAEEFTKPGTANVSPADRAKLSPLIRHYMSQPHPFTACHRDQVKHGLSDDHASRRCAVLKDLGTGTTHWRKGGGGKLSEALRSIIEPRIVVGTGLLLTLDDRTASPSSYRRAVNTGLQMLEPDGGRLSESARNEVSLREAVRRELREEVQALEALLEDDKNGQVPEELVEAAEGKGIAGGAMKRCPSCNWRNPAGATKCKKCHGELRKKGDGKLKEAALACRCGAELPPAGGHHRGCPSCGRDLREARRQAEAKLAAKGG